MNEPAGLARTAAGFAALIRRASRRVCGSFASGSAHKGIRCPSQDPRRPASLFCTSLDADPTIPMIGIRIPQISFPALCTSGNVATYRRISICLLRRVLCLKHFYARVDLSPCLFPHYYVVLLYEFIRTKSGKFYNSERNSVDRSLRGHLFSPNIGTGKPASLGG